MTYYISSKKEKVSAVVIDNEAFIMYDGVINKNYPAKYLPGHYMTVDALPFDFSKSLEVYTEKKAAFLAERKAASEKEAAAKYAERKSDILNLRAWRRGEIEAFIIMTYYSYNNDRNYADFGHESELIFGREKAIDYFEEVKESSAPDENEQYFVTDLLTAERDEDALAITNIEGLRSYIIDHSDIILSHRHAESIEDKNYIVTTGTGAFNRPSVRNGRIEERRTSGYWGSSIYWDAQITKADLGKDQYAVSLEDMCDGNSHEELKLAIEAGFVTREDCKELLSENDLYFYFEETEND